MSEASLFQGGYNFLGLPATLSAREHAKAWVLPVPYDATTSYAAGTRNGPSAIIAASRDDIAEVTIKRAVVLSVDTRRTSMKNENPSGRSLNE